MPLPPIASPGRPLDRPASGTRYARHLLLPEVGRTGQAGSGRPGAGRRGRWPGVAGPALPGGRRCGHARRGRRRRRRDHQPAAPGDPRRRRRRAGRRPSRPPRRSRGVNPLGDGRPTRPAPGLVQRARGDRATTTSCWTAPTTSRPATCQRRLRAAGEAARVGVDLPLRRAGRRCGGPSTDRATAASSPTPPPPGPCRRAPRAACSGVLCAAIGSVQATEALKLLTGHRGAAGRAAAGARRAAPDAGTR